MVNQFRKGGSQCSIPELVIGWYVACQSLGERRRAIMVQRVRFMNYEMEVEKQDEM